MLLYFQKKDVYVCILRSMYFNFSKDYEMKLTVKDFL